MIVFDDALRLRVVISKTRSNIIVIIEVQEHMPNAVIRSDCVLDLRIVAFGSFFYFKPLAIRP